MKKENAEYSAASLYEGGWRSEDKEELKSFYSLTEEEAEQLTEEIKAIEEIQ